MVDNNYIINITQLGIITLNFVKEKTSAKYLFLVERQRLKKSSELSCSCCRRMDTTRTLLCRLRSLAVAIKHTLPIHNLVIIEDYPGTLRNLEHNDQDTWFRFKVFYLLLAIRLANTVVLLVVPDLSTSSRILMSDYAFLLNIPSSFQLFDVVFLSMAVWFHYAMYHRAQGNPTMVMGSHFVFAASTSEAELRRYIRLVIIIHNGFLQMATGIIGVLVVVCEVKMHQVMFQMDEPISPVYYLATQCNWFLFAFGFYTIIHIAALTMSNLFANNSLALYRLHRTVHDFSLKLNNKNVLFLSIYVYFRWHCHHLQVIDRLSKVYNFVSFGIIIFEVPVNAYVNMLILLRKVPKDYMVSSYQIVGGQCMSILMMQALFAMYPVLVHRNVKLIQSRSIRANVSNVRARWKMAAHFEHFHVPNSHRYGLTYLGISLVSVVSLLVLLKTYSELMMICYRLIAAEIV